MAPIKLVILRNNLSYLMGEVTELDEEPSYLITGCMLMEGDKFTSFPLHTDQRYCNKINTRVAASLMGHSHQTHLEYYGRWVPTGSIRSSLNELLS